MDVIPQGLVGLLLAALEVPGVPRVDVRPLEVPDKDPLEIRPVMNVVMWEEFEPCSNMFPHVDGEVLNDEVIIIHSFGSVGEPKVFEPYTGGSSPWCIWRCWWAVGSVVGTVLSGCGDQRLMALGHLGWGFSRSVGHHAWGAHPRTPRWSSRGPRRLLSPPFDGRHHRAGRGIDC